MYVPVISLPTLLPPSLNSLNRCSVPYSFKRPLVVFDSLSVLCLKGTLRTLLGLDDYRTKTCKQGVLVPSYLRTINLVSQTPLKNTVGVLCLSVMIYFYLETDSYSCGYKYMSLLLLESKGQELSYDLLTRTNIKSIHFILTNK